MGHRNYEGSVQLAKNGGLTMAYYENVRMPSRIAGSDFTELDLYFICASDVLLLQSREDWNKV